MEQLVLLRAWKWAPNEPVGCCSAVLCCAGTCAAEKELNYSERDGTGLSKEFKGIYVRIKVELYGGVFLHMARRVFLILEQIISVKVRWVSLVQVCDALYQLPAQQQRTCGSAPSQRPWARAAEPGESYPCLVLPFCSAICSPRSRWAFRTLPAGQGTERILPQQQRSRGRLYIR